MPKNLQFRYTVAIGGGIVFVALILAAMFFFQFRDLFTTIKITSNSTMSEALHGEATKRLTTLSKILSQDLVNPLYDVDMLAIFQLLQSIEQLDDIHHVMVIDPEGVIVHDGTEALDDYGKRLEIHEILNWISKESTPLLLESQSAMEIVSPIFIADEILGWVRIGLSRRDQLLNSAKMTDRLTNLISKFEQQGRYITIFVTIFLLIIGLLLAALISRRLVSPIRQLSEYAIRVGQGDYGIELQNNRQDELGQLIHAFNRMSRDLSSTTVSRQYLNDILNNMRDVLIVISEQGKILMVNQAASDMLGYARDKLENKSYLELIDYRDSERVKKWLSQVMEDDADSLDARYLTANGQQILVSLSGAYLKLKGMPKQIICVAQDVSERRRNEEHIRYLAQYDGLTNLPNRQLFRDRLKHAMEQAERGEYLIALMFIDLDQFKKVNDSLGHLAGDRLLKEAALRLKKILRLGDTVARLGGDEFTVIAEQIKSIHDSINIAKAITETIREPFEIEGRKVYISCSIGMVFYPFAKDDLGSLVQKADMAMYQAKRSGRGQYRVYSHLLGSSEDGILQLENELIEALELKSFHLLYQPLVYTKTGIPTAMEALLRWDNPRRGTLEPTEFLPFLENSGLIVELGDWVLERACLDMLSNDHLTDQPLRLNVNVSIHQFNQGDFSSRVESILKKTGFDPGRLELEITESSLVDDFELSRNIVRSLKKLGVRIAVDDFGTGYSSFAYLRDFDLDSLKLDYSFIKDLPVDNYAVGICMALIAMARIMNLNVVAEGVERVEQLQWLSQAGVDEYQGFYFSEPISLDGFNTRQH
ncbi:MAG: EAL domain-containing protein [Candidatus Thiodiazotropha sp. (ex Dulcina madagascariensis)]|nr:EAL domain-containing protein [Candidatus Thiodiazotropha sp. (ex Dulcina madagascariensis)]